MTTCLIQSSPSMLLQPFCHPTSLHDYMSYSSPSPSMLLQPFCHPTSLHDYMSYPVVSIYAPPTLLSSYFPAWTTCLIQSSPSMLLQPFCHPTSLHGLHVSSSHLHLCSSNPSVILLPCWTTCLIQSSPSMLLQPFCHPTSLHDYMSYPVVSIYAPPTLLSSYFPAGLHVSSSHLHLCSSNPSVILLPCWTTWSDPVISIYAPPTLLPSSYFVFSSQPLMYIIFIKRTNKSVTHLRKCLVLITTACSRAMHHDGA